MASVILPPYAELQSALVIAGTLTYCKLFVADPPNEKKFKNQYKAQINFLHKYMKLFGIHT